MTKLLTISFDAKWKWGWLSFELCHLVVPLFGGGVAERGSLSYWIWLSLKDYENFIETDSIVCAEKTLLFPCHIIRLFQFFFLSFLYDLVTHKKDGLGRLPSRKGRSLFVHFNVYFVLFHFDYIIMEMICSYLNREIGYLQQLFCPQEAFGFDENRIFPRKYLVFLAWILTINRVSYFEYSY